MAPPANKKDHQELEWVIFATTRLSDPLMPKIYPHYLPHDPQKITASDSRR
jgi:hypothetical protein